MGFGSFRSVAVVCTPLLLLPLVAAKPQPRLLQAGGNGAAPPGMQEFNTEHYRIHTDLDPELARDLARRLDVMYDAYSYRLRLFTGEEKTVPRFEVYLFRRQDDYLKLTGERRRNTGGIFMSGRNLLASFLGGQGRDAIRRTLQHEAFHQFAHAVISQDLPVWLNEGLAQVFEEAVWNGSTFVLEQVPPRRLRQLQSDMEQKRLLRFEALMAMTPDEWSKRLEDDHDAGATQYNQSWAMVYFLINARDEQGQARYRGRLLHMLALLHDGQPADAAFKGAFGENLAGFQKRFVEYARNLKPTAEATLMENQEVLADLLVELRNRGTTFDSVTEMRTAAVKAGYRMHYSRGMLNWSSQPDISTYFKDLDGRPFTRDELYFFRRAGAPLPDLVCRWAKDLQFRTRFYEEGGKIEHELLVEPVASSARIVGAGS
jgi:hypothetical protein